MTNSLALHIRALKFRYPGAANGSWVVDIPDFQLAAGEQVLLTGGSGTGKSTLLQLIAGLLDPTEGSAEIAGTDLTRLAGSKRDMHRGRHVGMIFQTFNLLHGFSAAENVMAALMFSAVPPSKHRDTALGLLKQLGIDRPEADPDRLSVGQQQRVAVARSIACRPALVLADEPTASLDPENTGAAMDLVQNTCRSVGAALLCVSHDPSMAGRFERRLALKDLMGGSPDRSSHAASPQTATVPTP